MITTIQADVKEKKQDLSMLIHKILHSVIAISLRGISNGCLFFLWNDAKYYGNKEKA